MVKTVCYNRFEEKWLPVFIQVIYMARMLAHEVLCLGQGFVILTREHCLP